jgi:hypothetical protein
MSVSERRAERAVAIKLGTTNGDGLRLTTSAADLTPTSAWSRRERLIGGLIQAAFAAFWLMRGSAAIGGGVATGIAAGLLLVGTAVAGFHDLMGVRRAAEHANAKEVVFSASAGARL